VNVRDALVPPPRPRLGVIMLHWRNYSATRRCLESLDGVPYAPLTLYLIDNASGDGSMERLETEFSGRGFVFMGNAANLGFAAGCNVGIRRALEDGCDYVLLLNNDCVVIEKDFLTPAIALAESDPNCGIVGGKILFWPDTTTIWSTGGFIRFWGDEKHLGHGEKDRGQFERVSPRRFISGALMLIKRAVLERVGLLPDAYFFGKEEWEFSTRTVHAGFTLLYHPGFRIAHEASNSHDGRDPTYVYNGTLSKILYKRRNLPPAAFALWRITFGTYLHAVLPLRFRLQPQIFLQCLPPAVIRDAALTAFHDESRIGRVTLELLEDFRRTHPPPARQVVPGASPASER
jgi:GT2 family glycosyltransferase